jgi:hypothetical protein
VKIDLADYESEIEDPTNPKDELKKKIVVVACTIRNWHDETMKARKSVRDQLREILDLGLNTYKMQKTELRKVIEEIFLYHEISESWLRKLLPEGLKDTSKTRISYLQRQEMEKERRTLLQQSALKYRHGLDYIEYDVPNSSTMESISFQPLQPETTQPSSEIKQDTHDQQIQSSYSSESINLQSELNEAHKKIEKLEADILRLSEQFVAKANLQAYTETIPVVAHIDPVRKIIIRIGFEKGSGI